MFYVLPHIIKKWLEQPQKWNVRLARIIKRNSKRAVPWRSEKRYNALRNQIEWKRRSKKERKKKSIMRYTRMFPKKLFSFLSFPTSNEMWNKHLKFFFIFWHWTSGGNWFFFASFSFFSTPVVFQINFLSSWNLRQFPFHQSVNNFFFPSALLAFLLLLLLLMNEVMTSLKN